MKNKQIIVIVLVSVISVALGFYGGTYYQKTQKSTPNLGQNQFNRIANRNQTGGTRNGFRPVSGDILSIDDKSMTVKLTDGGSRIVILSEKMTIGKTSVAQKGDLIVGEKVSVIGQDNPDGSVTAQNIQINPMNFRQELATPSAAPKK